MRAETGTPNPLVKNARATGLRSLVAKAKQWMRSPRSYGPEFWEDAAEGCVEAHDWMRDSEPEMRRALCDLIGFSMPELLELAEQCKAKQADAADATIDWGKLIEEKQLDKRRTAQQERDTLKKQAMKRNRVTSCR